MGLAPSRTLGPSNALLRCIVLSILAGLMPGTGLGRTDPGADSGEPPVGHETETEQASRVFGYDPKVGLVYESGDGNTALWAGLRLQLRGSSIRSDPDGPEASQGQDDIEATRARIKLGGHVWRPWLALYFEDDFKAGRFLDYQATVALARAFRFRAGQWKSEYNRERVDSSGKQQLVDRSIANYWFTLDRQLGIAAMGRLAEGGTLDSSYWLEALSGLGRGGGHDADSHLWMGRYQWNFLGIEPAFSQSNLKYRDGAAGALSFGWVGGESPYTRFSSLGGGQLPGYPDGDANRYRIRQLMQGSYFQSGGFSWQQELHWKQVESLEDGAVRRLWGGYLQAGYFPGVRWTQIPEALELALRFGLVDPDTRVSSDLHTEYTLGVNWFFSGHRNKLTADLSYLRRNEPTGGNQAVRVQIQWDVSI